MRKQGKLCAAAISFLAFYASAQAEPYRNQFMPPQCEVEAEFASGEPRWIGEQYACDEACVQAGSEVSERVRSAAERMLGFLSSLQSNQNNAAVEGFWERSGQILNSAYSWRYPFSLDQILSAFAFESLPSPCAERFVCVTATGCADDPDGEDCQDVSLLPFQFAAKGSHIELNQLRYEVRDLAQKRLHNWGRHECKEWARTHGGSVKRCINSNQSKLRRLDAEWEAANQAILDYTKTWPAKVGLAWICRN